jgi:hypothetical protein
MQDRAISRLCGDFAMQKRRELAQDKIIEYQRKAIDLLVDSRDIAYSTIGLLKDRIKELEQRRT